MHLLFWLSLVPFSTGWMGENHFAPHTVALYGVTLFMAGVAYYILQLTIIRSQGASSVLAAAVGRDVKGKISPVLYGIAIVAAFYNAEITAALYAAVALMCLFPDQRIERAVAARARAERLTTDG
jgi:uncharacterized membrane protein